LTPNSAQPIKSDKRHWKPLATGGQLQDSEKHLLLAGLVASEEFQKLARLAERPNLFRAVGRTGTETWHSAFLGWLLDPTGSHGLRDFPLVQFLTTAATLRQKSGAWPANHPGLLSPAELASVAVTTDLSLATVLPNETAGEYTLPDFPVGDQGDVAGKRQRFGRPDVYVDARLSAPETGVGLRNPTQFICLIELKVGSELHSGQEVRYPAYVENFYANGTGVGDPSARGVCIFVAPGIDDTEPVDTIMLGDDRWYALSYQTLHDKVLLPCLAHERLDVDMRPLVEHYVRTLRLPAKGAKMVITKEERDLAQAIYSKHHETLELLADCLTSLAEPAASAGLALTQALPGKKQPLVLTMPDGQEIRGQVVSDFFRAALAYADRSGKLTRLNIPVATGPVGYLLNFTPNHASGKAFHNWTEYRTLGGLDLYVDTNYNRNSALSTMSRFLRQVGLTHVSSGVATVA
jgi:hypothetical protein